jgi:hypothetical protein
MASTYLSRSTASGTDTVWTWSGWLKRSKLSSSQTFFGTGNGSSSANSLQIRFSDDDTLDYRNFVSSSYNGRLSGGRKYRDTSAWYHFVFVWDTTQASSGNRMKAYCNGETITGFTDIQDPGLNSSAHTSGSSTFIGTDGYGGSTYFDGCLSHVHFIDGTAYDPTVFGETDATTGEWKGKTSPSVTYGTNGFFILKDGNGITDQSGEGNDFTLGGGTLTDLKDNPDNTFATLNPLDKGLTSTSFNLSNGNLTMGNAANTNDYGLRGTLGASSGKYYWEIKAVNGGEVLGITKSDTTLTINNMSGSPDAGFWGWQSNGTGASINSYNNGTFSNSNALQGYASNSIIGVALDMDNGKLYMSIDGVWKDADNNTSDPANQTNPFYTTIPTDGTFIMPYTEHRSSGDPASHWNFGNGYFGTTAVSSAGTNASDNGIFEYDVPTGYTALSTKGLNL